MTSGAAVMLEQYETALGVRRYGVFSTFDVFVPRRGSDQSPFVGAERGQDVGERKRILIVGKGLFERRRVRRQGAQLAHRVLLVIERHFERIEQWFARLHFQGLGSTVPE